MTTVSRPARLRWWQAGAVISAACVVCNLAILGLGSRLIRIDEGFTPLQAGPIVLFTLSGVAGATALYAFLLARVRRPYRIYVTVALIALLLSLLPDIALTQVALTGDPQHSIPQANWAEAALLMAMHIATAVLCITLLPRWPLLRRGPQA